MIRQQKKPDRAFGLHVPGRCSRSPKAAGKSGGMSGGRVTALLIILTENNKKATKIHGRLGPARKEKIFGGRRRKGTGTVDTLHETRPVDPGKYNQMTKKIFRKIPISALKFIQNDDRLQVVRRGNRLGPPWVLPVFT